jgi:hypothetical protein
MTTNNEVKAPRPCMLPKEWEGTGIIDSNNGYRLEISNCSVTDTDIIMFISGSAVYKKVIKVKRPSEYQAEVQKSQIEVALAIASAQRPWLKAEGFEFTPLGKGVKVFYRLMHKSGHEFTGYRIVLTEDQVGQDWDYFRLTLPNGGDLPQEYFGSRGNGSLAHGYGLCKSYDLSEILAFKPISDSQEAWDAVAHVEVYKESTNDTKTNG